MTITSDCRLLCASGWGYSIVGDGPMTDDKPYSTAVGCTDQVIGFAKGIQAINACFVGTNADGVVLSFRGTQPPGGPNAKQIVIDWFNDFHAEFIDVPHIPGRVHAGFWRSLDTLWPSLVPELEKRLNAAPGRRLFITGHSKGGGIAPLAAMRLAEEEGIVATVRTFAAPHAGSEQFAAAYNAKVPDTVRYEYADDLVPHVPPSLAFRQMFHALPFFNEDLSLATHIRRFDLNYTSVGKLRYIKRNLDVVDDDPTLRFTRFATFSSLLVQRDFRRIVDDHSRQCGEGYMSALCPTGVCP